MQTHKTNYSQIGYFPKTILDYLNGNKKLAPFYKYHPDIKSFQQTIEDKQKQAINRQLLVEVLKEQYGGEKFQVSSFKFQVENIHALLQPNAFTITTGHQLCLFTGPLYFIYKLISTINLAETLKKAYPDYHFVPVYWMASEDHDFEEINHIHLFGKTVKWNNKQGGGVGEYSNSGIEEVIDELRGILGESQNAKELISLFENAYLKHAHLSDATRYLVNELFGEYGLVVIDGDDKRLKKEFACIMQDDIINNTPFKLVNQTNQKLSENYKIQVNPRKINSFYLDTNLRERIVKRDSEIYEVLKTSYIFKKEEIIQEIESHPEHFSPNVILRPLYQEKILPNLAYIGGAAELSYWLQLKSVFDYYKINFPILILRNSVLWIDSSTNNRLNKLGIQPTQLFQDTEQLIKQYLKKTSDTELCLKQEEEKIKAVFEDIILRAEKIDFTLKATINAELKKQLKGIRDIEKRLLKAEKQKQQTAVNQIKKIKGTLFPNNILQERYDNFIPYYLKHGKGFRSILKDALQPLTNEFLILGE